jgi:arylsulfatase A-like enzyme
MIRSLALALAFVVTAQALAETSSSRPNILLAIVDDASYPHMSDYGCAWVNTPGFDRVAREGLLFTRAYTPNAKCSPSRSCLLTGRNSWQLGEAANHVPFFPPTQKVFTETLSQAGYFVGFTGKGWAPGVARDANGKDRQLTGVPFQKRKQMSPAKGIANNNYAANFADFLDAKPAEAPFCFWYGGFESHRRYEYGSGVAKGGKRLSDIDHVPGYLPDNDAVRTDMLDYAFEIEHFDRHLSRMLDLLDQRKELENTLVVVTADNGASFPRVKSMSYEASVHMPLAIMWPKGIEQPGRTVEDFVSSIDLAPTFIEVAGLDWKATELDSTPGRSLTDIFRADANRSARDRVLLGKERHDVGRPGDVGYPIRGIVKGDLLYLRNFETSRWPAGNPETGYLATDASPTKTYILDHRTDPAGRLFWDLCFGKHPGEELYRLSDDPDCVHNLAGDAAFASQKRELWEQLERELRDQQDPRMDGRGDMFDRFPYAHAQHRGFYERYMSGEKVNAGWADPSDFEEQPLEE